MKKLYLFLFATLAFCAGCQTEKETPDLALADARGPVKSIQRKSFSCDKDGNVINESNSWNNRYFEFDEDGNMTVGFIEDSESARDTIRLYRDDKGAVDVIQTYDPVWDSWYDTEVTYDDDMRVAGCTTHSKDCISHITFDYNDDGYRTIGKEVNITGDPYIGVTRYKILEKDNHGNWTRIICTVDYDISGEKTQEMRLDKREITYY